MLPFLPKPGSARRVIHTIARSGRSGMFAERRRSVALVWGGLTRGYFVEQPKAAHKAILRAEALLAKGLASQAENQAISAIRYRPGLQQAYEMLGKALDGQGRTEEATGCYRGELSFDLLNRHFQNVMAAAQRTHQADAHQGAPGLHSFPIHAAQTHVLPASISITPQVDRASRQKRISSNATSVHAVDGGSLWHDSFNTVVFDRTECAVTDMTKGSLPVIEAARRRCRPYHLGKRAFLLGARGAGNYFHWMTDILPKLELARLAGYEFTPEDVFVVSFNKCPFQLATLEHLGIQASQVYFTAKGSPYISADTLVVPQLRNNMLTNAGDWLPVWLRRNFLDQTLQSTGSVRKLYVSRASKAATGRGIDNADAVAKFLKDRDFEEVFAEQLSVPEQAALFASASFIVAPHGAGLTNLTFCQPGTRVVELYGAHLSPCYRALSALCGLHYVNLDCTGKASKASGQDEQLRSLNARRGLGFAVDLDQLSQSLALAEAVGDQKNNA